MPWFVSAWTEQECRDKKRFQYRLSSSICQVPDKIDKGTECLWVKQKQLITLLEKLCVYYEMK